MPNTFRLLDEQRDNCCPTLAHAVHYHIHKPIKWLSAVSFIMGALLEHWYVVPVAAALFTTAHVVTWVLAD